MKGTWISNANALRIIVLFCCAWVPVGASAAAKTPWQRRVIRDVTVTHSTAYAEEIGNVTWPDEPETPKTIDPDRFLKAMKGLCGALPRERGTRIRDAVLRESARFEEDPFLIGAMIWDQSRCVPWPKWGVGYGLTRIMPEVHEPHIRGGKYKYFVFEADTWKPEALDVSDYRLSRWSLSKPEASIYFTAAILKVWRIQHESLDERLGGRPHRHYVSHWFFGDIVKSREPEDRVLTVRRRLLDLYHDATPKPAGAFYDVPLVFPLDGSPRLLYSPFGMRGKGKSRRLHEGIDLLADEGEPVRAAADGKVVFAGLDQPGNQVSRPMTPEEARHIERRGTTEGGLYILLAHGNGVRTAYMHLHAIAVIQGDQVTAGQVIGEVGRTGVKTSGSHLHFELKRIGEPVDAAELFEPYLVRRGSKPK